MSHPTSAGYLEASHSAAELADMPMASAMAAATAGSCSSRSSSSSSSSRSGSSAGRPEEPLLEAQRHSAQLQPAAAADQDSLGPAAHQSAGSVAGQQQDLERRHRPQKYCAVCGDKAIACNFNAVTCESCKAFFRRNAFKEQRLKCLFESRCIIDRVTRRFCSKCRLLKCFHIGMKREWILTDEQKQIKRVKIMQNKQSKRQVASISPTLLHPQACQEARGQLAAEASAAPVAATTTLTAPPAATAPQLGLPAAIADPSSCASSSAGHKQGLVQHRPARSRRVEMRDASTSCPDQFELASSPSARSLPHYCSLALHCHYCSLWLADQQRHQHHQQQAPPPTPTTSAAHHPMQTTRMHQHTPATTSAHYADGAASLAAGPMVSITTQPQPCDAVQTACYCANQQTGAPHSAHHQSHQMYLAAPAGHFVAGVVKPPATAFSGRHAEHVCPSAGFAVAAEPTTLAASSLHFCGPSAPELSHLQPLGRSSTGQSSRRQVSCDGRQHLEGRGASATSSGGQAKSREAELAVEAPSSGNSGGGGGGGGGGGENDCTRSRDETMISDPTESSAGQSTHAELLANTPDSALTSTTSADGDRDRTHYVIWNGELYSEPATTELESRARVERIEFSENERELIYEMMAATRFMFETSSDTSNKETDRRPACSTLQLNDLVHLCDAALRRLIQTVKRIKSFRLLSMDDQIVLLKTACLKILLLRSTYHYLDECDGWMDQKTGRVMRIDLLKDAKKSSIYERHHELLKNMPIPFRRDRLILGIIALTCLFDPTVSLKHSNSVTLDNLIYLSVLRKYLVSTQPDPLTKYQKLIDLLKIIDTCSEAYTICFSKDFQPDQVTPLLNEIFDISINNS